MATKAEWKAATAALQALERERESATRETRAAYDAEMTRLLAPTKEQYDALKERIGEIEGEIGEPFTFCEGGEAPIWDGDKYHAGSDVALCEECAPSYGDILASPSHFLKFGEGDEDDRPMNADEAKAIVDAHLAAGGSLADKMVSP
jgi:hypothetical protein